MKHVMHPEVIAPKFAIKAVSLILSSLIVAIFADIMLMEAATLIVA